MSEGYDPRFRPMVIWRWHSAPARDHILWALDQAAAQQLGGIIIAPPHEELRVAPSSAQALGGGDPTSGPPSIKNASAPFSPFDSSRRSALAEPERGQGGCSSPSADLLAYAIAEGAHRGLMMWVALPDPPPATNPLHPQQVQHWLHDEWSPRLTTAQGAIPGLSGLLINAVRPPLPVAGTPWDDLFTEAFLDQKGYIPDKARAKHPQVLVDIHDVYTTLLAAAWYGMVGEWCDEFGLSLIGCVANAARPILQPEAIAKYVAAVDIPALALPIHHHASLLEKTIHSASVLSLRPRTAVILQSGPLHAYSLDNLKRTTERLVVAGIDMLILDGFGPLAPDTSFSYAMPQWPHVHHWTRYANMLCKTFGDAQDSARVAVLDPSTSSWARGEQPETRSVADQFESLRTELDDAQVAYLVIDEATCARFTAVDGRLFVRGLWFDALIVPPMTHLCEATVIALRRLGDQSRIFAFGAGDIEVIALAGQPDYKPPRRVSLRSIEGLLFTYGDTLRRSDVFWHAIQKTITLSAGADIRWRRVESNGAAWCLGVNEGLPRSVTASLVWPGRATIYNDATEAFEPATLAAGRRPDTIDIVMDLMDHPAILLQLDGPPQGDGHKIWKTESRIEILGPWQCTPHDGNMLRIRHWPFQCTLDKPVAHVHVLAVGISESAAIQLDGLPLPSQPWDSDPAARVFTHDDRIPAGIHTLTFTSDLAGRAWLLGDFAVIQRDPPQLAPVPDVRPGPWEDRGLPDFSGAATYIAEFHNPGELIPRECQLVVPHASGVLELEINGQTAAIRPWPPYRATVTKLLRAGSNLISITMSNTLSNMMSGPDTDHPSGLVETPFLEFGTWSRPA